MTLGVPDEGYSRNRISTFHFNKDHNLLISWIYWNYMVL